ncbi:MAG: phosphoenolpyruvate--protein phosphotransferase [Betaproteobacteria bacterium]|nr:phosphoenolpyruvate--protein phosphotransferase [Betaproteobacteria bacterium]
MSASHPIIRRQITVVNDWGLHARPCAAIATEAGKHDCDIQITNGKKAASANSVAQLLMLEAHNGTLLTVTARGQRARQAIDAISEIIGGGFGERHLVLKGIGNKCGIALGRARLQAADHSDIPHFTIGKGSIAAEQRRLRNALQAVRRQFEQLSAGGDMPDAEIDEFRHLLLAMLDDALFSKEPLKLIASENANAEWALKLALDPVLAALKNSPEELLQARYSDYSRLMQRIIAQLDRAKVPRRRRRGINHVLISIELGPAEVVEAVRAGYEGLVAADGTRTSHATILSRSLLVPAIVGCGEQIFEQINENDMLIVDSDGGLLHVNPSDEVCQRHRQIAREQEEKRKSATRQSGKVPPSTETRDGHRIQLLANIEVPEEIPNCHKQGVEGIGLFRTESLFLEKDEIPGEEDQYQIYRRVLAEMAPLPVTFRTMDLGYDKSIGKMSATVSAMGLRGIRYCLRNPELFKSQLRALLRAAPAGNMRIMLPMVGTAEEVQATRALIEDGRAELDLQDQPTPQIGVMIEIPATIHLINSLAQTCDFFSVGSNDLVSYLLAIDRRESQLSNQHDPRHPAVISALKDILQRARQTGKPVTLCGEIAGDTGFARLLATLGLASLSMVPDRIMPMRKLLKQTSLKSLEHAVGKACQATDSEQIVEIMSGFDRQ